MDLTHVIAERENKKIYRDGAKAIKVFAEGYSKADDSEQKRWTRRAWKRRACRFRSSLLLTR